MKYLKFVNTDGIGRQLIVHNKMRYFAKKNDLKIIFDFRERNYFRGERIDIEKINKYFVIDPSVIYNFDEIDAIPRCEIVNIGNIERITKLYGNSYQSKKELELVAEFHSEKNPKLDYLFIKSRDIDINFANQIKDSVGVHARLGNGEFDKIDRHRLIDKDKILKKMYIESDNTSFFVCTDTESFLDECKEKFKDRVICYQRKYVKEGWGPGHNIGYVYKNKEDKKHNSYQTMHDALSELYFLSLVKKIIHTGGSFPKYAADSNIPSINLKRTKNEN